MSGTHFSGLVYQLGGMPVLPYGLPIPPGGTWYFVDPANGNNGNDGKTPETAVADLATAYGKCTDGQNDVVAYMAGATSLTLTAALTWSKSYTHLVGLCAPTAVGKRARIFQLSTLTGASPLLTISGSGCVFANFYIFQGVDDATSLVNVSVTGGRNYFWNVHFAGGGHATQAIDGGASLKLDGAEECTFDQCVIGVDTIAAGNGLAGVVVDSDAKRCVFRNCLFTLYAGHAGAKFVEIADNAGFDRYLLFENCLFINDATGYTLTEAFTVPDGMGSATHRIVLKDCSILGAGEVESNDRGIVYMNMGAITAGGNAGLMQATNTT